MKLRKEMQELIDESDQRVSLSQAQQEKMSITLRTLNGIFVSMRSDADNSRGADLRDAYSVMEKRIIEREKELTTLRPLKNINEELKESCNVQTEKIDVLTKELEVLKLEVGQRDAMVSDLLRQEGERS